ncbi:Cof-type HAD-IIB family hydrolase [Gulosibacter molinativorax]|uniref:Cof-type HAD-IIB family hydrolase n=1 Tax=Gulosibacter molinativorax TaxID=256821 RepID=A0ABT7C8T6_9MICO|nr:Cof-type HAD-IIB family hydrolase [Gulosibacter molinativorax]MDJ1371600.1 Cof-type HAD-IIB family hydrolase [Gulosibacter molinativorax]QUY61057.1 Putative hydrolase [Gulosibacter molinativorax]
MTADANNRSVPRRAIFIDADGTLLNDAGVLRESSVTAVREAREAGHLCFLSTGRSRIEIPDALGAIEFDGIVTSNGGFAFIGGELVESRTMPEAVVGELIAYFEAEGYDYYLQGIDFLDASPGVQIRIQKGLEELALKHGDDMAGASQDLIPKAAREAMAAHRPVRRQGIAKAMFLGNDAGAFERVNADLSERFEVVTGTIPQYGTASGEVTPHGMNKGTTMLRVLKRVGIERANSVAIGDSMNDRYMLEVAGLGIAMGNASAELKARADSVTRTIDEDGVWAAFVEHGLIAG